MSTVNSRLAASPAYTLDERGGGLGYERPRDIRWLIEKFANEINISGEPRRGSVSRPSLTALLTASADTPRRRANARSEIGLPMGPHLIRGAGRCQPSTKTAGPIG